MLRLQDIAFFSKLTERELNSLKKYIEVTSYKPGSVIIEASESCQSLLAIAKGKVEATLTAQAHSSKSTLELNEGTVISELSLIANIQIPASLVALEETELMSISHDSFNHIQEDDPSLYDALIKNLTTRLQYKSPFELSKFKSYVSVFVFQDNNEDMRTCLKLIKERVEAYSSQSKCLADASHDLENLSKEIQSWKTSGLINHPLLIFVNSTNIFKLGKLFNQNDHIVFIDCFEAYETFNSTFKRAETVFVSINEKSTDLKHYYKVKTDQGIDIASIDRIVRLVTKKEIGLALGAGAARGFSHLGILQVFEDEKIPIDFLCGTSIGGVIALTYSLCGSAYKAADLIKDAIGSKNRVQDISLIPRQSLLAGKKIKRAAAKVFGDSCFADLSIPVEVVSSDLGQAARHVIDIGLLRDAVLATSAIPGIFPPVIKDGRVLVDGALTSKVPVGLLRKRKTCLKVAVNATTAKGIFSCDPDSKSCATKSVDGIIYDLQNTFELSKGINLGSIINHSWDLLSWSEASVEAARADIVINPDTSNYSNFAFDDFDDLITIGRQAVKTKLKAIKVAVKKVIEKDSYCV